MAGLSSIARQMEAHIAQKTTPPTTNPNGVYYVENQGQRIGPFQTQQHATRRLNTETARWKAAGGRNKRPELIFGSRGNGSRARFPNGKPVPRLSPAKGKSAEDDQWDYRTNQPYWKNTPAPTSLGR